jgi:hypothetical protein
VLSVATDISTFAGRLIGNFPMRDISQSVLNVLDEN